MMNIVALAFLVSYFSAVVVLVPEPHLTQADHPSESYTPGGIYLSARDSLHNAVCEEEPCPSSMDQVKDTVHRGYDKTAEGIDRAKEGAKETVKGVYEQTKHGVQDKTEQAKEGIQETAGKVKHGAYETAQGIQDKAGQAKDGVYETAEQAKENVKHKAGQVKHGAQDAAEKVASYVPGAEDVKRGSYETKDKLGSYLPSKEEAASYIPGAETGKEAANALKQKVGEAKERVSSYVEDSDPVSYSKESLDNLRSKLEDARREAAQFLHGREKESAFASFSDVKKNLDEAYAYIPSKDSAVSYIPGMDVLRSKLDETTRQVSQYMQGREKEESYPGFAKVKRQLEEASSYIPYILGVGSIYKIKKGMQETAQTVQDKVQGVGESARDTAKGSMQGMRDKTRDVGDGAHDTASSYKEAGEASKGKLGGMFQGMKERFTGAGPKTRGGVRDGSGQLVRRVHELCMWFGDETEMPRAAKGAGPPFLDVAASRESYAYLMQSALSAIERAHELFDHATVENTGGEWREKYVYLADSAKGALEAGKEVFERAASAAEGTVRPRRMPTHKVSFGKSKNGSKLGEVAAHSKERLSAILRPFLRTIYLATFSAIYGIALWITFLSGHLLSRTLPRQQLGVVQSKLFPVYLRMITACVALCGLTHALLHPWQSADRSEHWQYVNFGLCTGLALLNMLVVEPKATKMMFEKLRVEKEEGRGQSGEEVSDDIVKQRIANIDTKFRGLHQMASYLNLGIVAGLSWHLWYLANRLVV
ncbi:hypothetical protein L7F22_022343 [Adiantum nelumboides]|nr:hypothetical protein [Adiantum nelumboides]